ncbi:WRKY family transcription factor [Medicago truncatula]|uniref:WRKY family transcription factor n=2 Tax=Medicago truncatula TaxID=3880 RepID=G7IXC7_MEDTR|nr:WRKY family transcription factor [Medicago truncatula]
MPIRISNRLIQKNQWRILGFFSSIMGFISYASSSSFNHLFGKWNFIKIIIYTVVSFSISSMMLFLKKWKLSKRFLLRAHLGVLVLLLTSLYSFVSDKASNEKPDLLSMISCVAFALMSFCLSRQIDLGFESDLLNFFLGILTVQLMKINLILSIVAAILCYSLIVLRSKLGSRHEIGTLRVEDDVAIEIDGVDNNRNEFQSDYSNGRQQNKSSVRRMNHDDGYNWKKYEEKVAKGSENQRSYYKCTWPNCFVKKKVERTIDGEVIETLYKGTHNHWKPTSSMKRNSSSEYLYSLLPSETGSIDLQDQSFGSEQLDSDEEPTKSSVSI